MDLAPAAADPAPVVAEPESKGKGKGQGKVMHSEPFTGKPHATCPVKISCYAHIALVVTDEAGSLEFLAKFGFKEKSRKGNAVILANPNTEEKFEIHLLLQPDGIVYAGPYGKDTGINVLMDMPDQKAVGHTHIAFSVPSLPTTKAYLTVCTVHITGERPNAAFFCRDTDRNVFELVGPMVGDEKALNPDNVLVSVHHMGTRISDAAAASKWYSEMLGFGERVFWYDQIRENPSSNGGPWVIFNEKKLELNLLLNCSDPGVPNVLLDGPASAGLCPGIIYPALQVDNFDESIQFLQKEGVQVLDDAAASTEFGLGAARISPVGTLKSRFIRDVDGNIIRLIGL